MKKLSIILAALAAVACNNNLPVDEELQAYRWSVQFEASDEPGKVINADIDDFAFEKLGRGEFKYTNEDATVVIRWKGVRNGMEVTPTVTNTKEGCFVRSIIGPLVPIDKKIEDYNILIPNGFGEIFTQTPKAEPEFTKANYTKAMFWKDKGKYFEICDASSVPSTPCRKMTMQWLAFAGAQDGLYIATHDPDFTFKQYNVRYYPGEDLCRFGLRSFHILFTGESWTYPTASFIAYKGDWHKAADIYREWFNSVKKTPAAPTWLKKSTGWLLAILKQQNDEIIWPYGDLSGTLADVAEARGLDIVGLYGWTVGGHDRFYPEYDICDKMGGEENLRKSLKEIRDRGMRSVIYVNGQLLDQNGTKYWADTGRFVTTTKADGSLAYETWHKYYDAPARTHGLVCHSCDVWRQRMLRLAMMAEDLGADGIIFDQLGNRVPMFCYNPNHGHAVPAIVYEQDRQSNLEYVQTEMTKINPEFIVMTEGTDDAEMTAIDMFHGCTYGVYDPNPAETASLVDKDLLPCHAFPQMLKYTLPQIECTVRHPSPVSSRNLLNYGTIFGFKHEIETRYAADRRYLLEDHIPVVEDYGNVTTKPDLNLVINEDPVAMRIYSKQVLGLRVKYSEALLEGTFKDNVGIALESDGPVLAKVFEAKDKSYSAVVLWNTSADAPASYSLTLNGRKPSFVDTPEGGPETSMIQPQALLVAIFK